MGDVSGPNVSVKERSVRLKLGHTDRTFSAGKNDRFLSGYRFQTVSDQLSPAKQAPEMPPKVRRATRRELKSSKSLAEEIEQCMRLSGFRNVQVTEFKCDSGKDDGSRRAPDEEEKLFLNKDREKWAKIVKREAEKFENRSREERHAQLKFTTKMNRNMSTEMARLAERNMLCIKKDGFYFTATVGKYITAHWTRAEAFSRMLASLELVPDLVLNLLRKRTRRDDTMKKFVFAFAVVDDVQHSGLGELAKDICDLKKDYDERFCVRSRPGEDDKILILGKNNKAVTPTNFSKWFSNVTPWLFKCQQVQYMCKMGERAAQESAANRGKTTVPSQDAWRKKMHDFKMALNPEIANSVALKLDGLRLVFAEGSAYKVKFGYPGRDGRQKFYMQLDALCSSKQLCLPDISLNDDGLCDIITAHIPRGILENSCTLRDVLQLTRPKVSCRKPKRAL